LNWTTDHPPRFDAGVGNGKVNAPTWAAHSSQGGQAPSAAYFSMP